MFLRLFLFLLGFGLMIIGFMYIILYLNLLTLGYKFSEYVQFISRQWITYNAVIGMILVTLTIYIPEGRCHE